MYRVLEAFSLNATLIFTLIIILVIPYFFIFAFVLFIVYFVSMYFYFDAAILVSKVCILGWRSWSDWSACSTTCGGGIQRRRRTCKLTAERCEGDTDQQRTCNQFHCTGQSLLSSATISQCDASFVLNISMLIRY